MEIKNKLQQQIDDMFESKNAPTNRASYELREEILANCLDRYQDQIEKGASSEIAYQSVVSNIGNVEELIAALPPDEKRGGIIMSEQDKIRSARTKAIAISLYVLAGVVLIAGAFLSNVFYDEDLVFAVTTIMAGLLCVVPTGMLVFNAYRYPEYSKKEDTVVENFKEWNRDHEKKKSIRGAVSSIIWCMILIAYFVISFATMAWQITWVLFLVGGCLEAIVSLWFTIKELR